MSLRIKLACGFLVPLAVTLITVSVLQIGYTAQFMLRDLNNTGDLLVRQIFEQMRAAHPSKLSGLAHSSAFKTFLASSLAFGEAVVSVRIDGPDGITVVAAPATLDDRRVPAAPSLASLAKRRDIFAPLAALRALWGNGVFEISRPVKINQARAGAIRIDLSTRLIYAKARSTLLTILYMLAIALGLGSVAGLVMVGTVGRSVEAITAEVDRLATAHSALRLPVGSRDELGRLADKFNQLSKRVVSDRDHWEHDRRQLFDVLRSINDAVMLLDSDGTVLFANPEALGRLGLPAGKSEGQSLESLLGAKHRLVRLVRLTMTSGVELNNTPMELNAGTAGRRFMVSLFPLSSESGKSQRLLIIRDVTPVNELEQAFARSSSLARQERLLGAIGHQIRNPLQAMTLQLRMLEEDGNDDGSRLGRVEALRSEIIRINEAVSALLRFLRMGQLNLVRFDLNQMVKEAALRAQHGAVRLQSSFDPAIGAVEGDRGLLAEALQNLISNGIQAMDGAGSLELITRHADHGVVEIVIRDHGRGIPPEQKERVFDLYFSTKEQGAGIGLPMARRIVEIHRGSLELDSRPGRGTTVRIQLPIRYNLDATMVPQEA